MTEQELREVIREELSKIQEVKNLHAQSKFKDYKKRYEELKQDVKQGEYTPSDHPSKGGSFKSIEKEINYLYKLVKEKAETYKSQGERLGNEKVLANYEKYNNLAKKVRSLKKRV